MRGRYKNTNEMSSNDAMRSSEGQKGQKQSAPDPVEDSGSEHLHERNVNSSYLEHSQLYAHSSISRHSWLPAFRHRTGGHEKARDEESEEQSERYSTSSSHAHHKKLYNHRKPARVNWYERHESLKGKKASDKPCQMQMLFFDTTKDKEPEPPASNEARSKANDAKDHKVLVPDQLNQGGKVDSVKSNR